MLEYVEYVGNYYGILFEYVEEKLVVGVDIFFEIEV